MTTRKEKRQSMRRRFNHRNRHSGSDCPWIFLAFDGDKRKCHLQTRTGGYRHQPYDVRRIVLGKKKYYTRAEQAEINEFVKRVVNATWAHVGMQMGCVTEEEYQQCLDSIKDLSMDREGME